MSLLKNRPAELPPPEIPTADASASHSRRIAGSPAVRSERVEPARQRYLSHPQTVHRSDRGTLLRLQPLIGSIVSQRPTASCRSRHVRQQTGRRMNSVVSFYGRRRFLARILDGEAWRCRRGDLACRTSRFTLIQLCMKPVWLGGLNHSILIVYTAKIGAGARLHRTTR